MAKKQISKVVVSFSQGGETSDKLAPVEIIVPAGWKFRNEIGKDLLINQEGLIERAFSWRAGYTIIYGYFYD